MSDLTAWESFSIWALAAFVAFWVFALGANLGSFLNVVVYRLPRGMPLALSVSRCPKCANPIAVRDNIPILSWLLLRGRCRACGQAISVRYPLVEAAVGSLFVLLFSVELLSGGANLPGRRSSPPGLLWLLTDPSWELVVITCSHACLIYLLLGIGLIQADRRPTPWKLAAVGILLGIPSGWFRVVPLTASWPLGLSDNATLQGLLTGLGGLAGGLAWGILHWRLPLLLLPLGPSIIPKSKRQAQAGRGVFVAMTLVGTYLGWQAATVVGLVTAALRLAAAGLAVLWPGLRRVPSAAYVPAVALLHILIWKPVNEIRYWPSAETPLLVLAAIIAAAVIVSFSRDPVASSSASSTC